MPPPDNAVFDIPLSLVNTRRQCLGRHVGPWLVEPRRFAGAVQEAIIVLGAGGPAPAAQSGEADGDGQSYEVMDGGIAVVPVHGLMMKGSSSFGDTCNTVAVRRQIRKAVDDASVKAILLHIDSPGGTCAGTAELGDDVAAADKKKPVYAYGEDVLASAAYWVASQARFISANRTADVGSIGTLAIVDDTSQSAEAQGVKVHVISTGDFKGAFVDGAPVAEEHLAYLQGLIDDANEHFLAAVRTGRQMPIAQVRTLADGRVHIAAKAAGLDLINAVEPLDAAVGRILRDLKSAGPARNSFTNDIAIAEAELG